MEDPRIKMEGTPMPFDVKRMSYGGFQVLVDLPSAPPVTGRRESR